MGEFASREYVDTQILNTRAELFGNNPPRFPNDVGRVGKVEAEVSQLRDDVKATRKSLKFMEGIPGIVVKLGGGFLVLKTVLDTLGVTSALKSALGGH